MYENSLNVMDVVTVFSRDADTKSSAVSCSTRIPYGSSSGGSNVWPMVPTSHERRANASVGICDGLLISPMEDDAFFRSRRLSMKREMMTDVTLQA